MASKKEEMNFSIDEVIECIKESPKNSWGKYIVRMSFNNKPSEINIRNMNIDNGRISAGIVLSDEEVELTVNKFVSMGYGDLNELEREVNKRKSRFNVSSFYSSNKEECDDVIHLSCDNEIRLVVS